MASEWSSHRTTRAARNLNIYDNKIHLSKKELNKNMINKSTITLIMHELKTLYI